MLIANPLNGGHAWSPLSPSISHAPCKPSASSTSVRISERAWHAADRNKPSRASRYHAHVYRVGCCWGLSLERAWPISAPRAHFRTQGKLDGKHDCADRSGSALVGNGLEPRRPRAVDRLVCRTWVGHDPARPGLQGREALKRSIVEIRHAFPDLHFTIEDLLTDRDRVVLRWTSLGTHLGEFLGKPATGRQVPSSGVDVYRIEPGMIAETWSHWDVLGVLRQLDVLPDSGMRDGSS